MCRDTAVVLAGKIKITENGPCDVPQNEFVAVGGLGGFTTYDGHTTKFAALVNADGDVDTNFTTNQSGGSGPNNNTVSDCEFTGDAIWLVGNFTTYNGTAAQRLIKLTNTGAIDGTYTPTTGLNAVNSTTTMNKFSDGAIAIAGNFTSYKGTTYNRIVAIDSTGTVDSTFNVGSGFNENLVDSQIKDDVLYTYAATTNLVTYKGASGSRFVSIDRQGNRIANFSLAGSDVPLYFDWTVDNVGRVYIAFIRSDYQRVIIQRWLPSGSYDPTYLFDHALPNLVVGSATSAPWCNIVINDNYECYVTAMKTDRTGAYVLKSTPAGALDLAFGTNQIAFSGAINTALVRDIKIANDGLHIASNFTGTSATATYNGTNVAPIFKVDLITGDLDTNFNNDATITFPQIRRFKFIN
jgi:hypothetical protein